MVLGLVGSFSLSCGARDLTAISTLKASSRMDMPVRGFSQVSRLASHGMELQVLSIFGTPGQGYRFVRFFCLLFYFALPFVGPRACIFTGFEP